MPLMIKLNRNIMKVYLSLDNGHFITVDRNRPHYVMIIKVFLDTKFAIYRMVKTWIFKASMTI